MWCTGICKRNDAGGSTATTRLLARGAPKNAGCCTKKLDSPGGAPYHSCIQGGACSIGAAGATEGPARQLWPATLASPPPRGVCSWCALIIEYFHHRVPIFFCVCIHHNCCLVRAWIFCIVVRSLYRGCRKATNSHVGSCACILYDVACSIILFYPGL